MAKESLQKKLDRVRPPRVQIKYEVDTGDAMEVRELPFVLGVMGSYSGKPDKPLPKMADRKFVNIDRDNFNNVMEGMGPRLAYRVDDKLSGETDKQMAVELRFKKLDDFSPEQVVEQIEPLKKLLETRKHLENLLSKMDGNDKLEELLWQVAKDADTRQRLAQQLGVEPPKAGGAEPAGGGDPGGSEPTDSQ